MLEVVGAVVEGGFDGVGAVAGGYAEVGGVFERAGFFGGEVVVVLVLREKGLVRAE